MDTGFVISEQLIPRLQLNTDFNAFWGKNKNQARSVKFPTGAISLCGFPENFVAPQLISKLSEFNNFQNSSRVLILLILILMYDSDKKLTHTYRANTS
jgi:O-acetyl-ADP-ribose deacetylase (regulator of RNase III)